jgi:transposase
MAYIQGTSRYQVEAQFLSLEEIINNSNPVRVIDAYVNSLDLSGLGFNEYSSSNPGQRPYDRKDLLKLHIYGYNKKFDLQEQLKKNALVI